LPLVNPRPPKVSQVTSLQLSLGTWSLVFSQIGWARRRKGAAWPGHPACACLVLCTFSNTICALWPTLRAGTCDDSATESTPARIEEAGAAAEMVQRPRALPCASEASLRLQCLPSNLARRCAFADLQARDGWSCSPCMLLAQDLRGFRRCAPCLLAFVVPAGIA
jgi:hypothetical protein